MYLYRKEIVSYCISTFFVLIAALLHILSYFQLVSFSVNILVFILYTIMILLWRRIMGNRILRTSSLRRFKSISYLLIGYLAIRTLKYEILLDSPMATKYIRYMYYFFSLNIVHLVFFTSLLIQKSENEPISKRWNWLWIPTELLVLLVLTNDLHEWAFSLSPGSGAERYGPLFYIILIYITVLAIASIVFTLIPAINAKLLRPVIPTMCILAIWAIYTFLYVFDWKPFFYVKIAFTSAEFNILVVILFIESLVFTRLIPSNRGYEGFLKLSALNIGVMDESGKIVSAPNAGPKITSTLIKSALGKPIMIDKDTMIESAEINGGQSFWFIDLKELNALKSKLYLLNEDLMSENDLLTADNKLKEKMAKLEEQNEIRSYIDAKLKPQFSRIKEIIASLPEDEEGFDNALKEACVLSVYIKRCSNLYLLSKSSGNISIAELGLAFTESLNYLKLSGVKTQIEWKVIKYLDAIKCLKIYEVFENAVERFYSKLSSVDVRLEKENNIIVLNISFEFGDLFSIDEKTKRIEEKSGFLVEEDMDGKSAHWKIYIEGGAV